MRVRVVAGLLWAIGVLTMAMTCPVQAVAGTSPAPRVVLLGVGGLEWSDVSAAATPNLASLLGRSSVAAVSVRTVGVAACPADAWLTLNTGVRTAALRRADGTCLDPGELLTKDGASVSRWADIGRLAMTSSYDPEFGLLSTGVSRRGCATAIGPGAGLALADAQGRVAHYTPRLDTADLLACPTTVVDLGTLPATHGRSRSEAARIADAAIGKVTTAVPAAEVLIVGLGNGAESHLQTLLVHGSAYGPGWIDANSTRHPGLVQLTDLTPTVLAGLGIPAPARAVGSILRTMPGAPSDHRALVEELRQFDLAAQTIDRNVVVFYWVVAAGGLLASGLLIAVSRRRRRWWSAVGQWLVLTVGSLPVASSLANLFQWWRSSSPSLVLWLGVIAWAAAIGTLAHVGPWRRHPLGSAGAVAGVTALALAVDVVTGSHLQLSSLWGLSPLDGGRFYGFGNVAFAAFAVSVLVVCAWVASILIKRGRRRRAVLVVVGIGAAAVVVDGWPSFGADFGGVLALIPAIALLAATVAGIRVSGRWVALTGAIAAGAVALIAVADWMRPVGSRSHLGNFVQQFVDGSSGSTLQRKLDATVQSFADRPLLSLLVAILMLGSAALVLRPERFAVLRACDVYVAEPLVRACAAACLVTSGIGLAVNDSGVIVPGICCAVAVPLLMHAWHSVGWRRL